MAGKITKVFNAADQIQAEVIHDHLKQNGIESISKQPGTGEYMNIAIDRKSTRLNSSHIL